MDFAGRIFSCILAMKLRSFFALSVVAISTFSGCYEVPVTGRHAMNLVDDKEITKMSIAMFDQMKSQHRVSRNKEQNEQLKRVGERLQRSISIWDMPDADWEFVVFDVPEINAFAMAGGKVGVFSGLFKIVKNDDQLASVLAHEIAHVTAKHVHEKASEGLAMETVGTVGMLGGAVAGAPLLTTEALGSIYGLGSGLVGLKWDRKKEKEADQIGLIYMARAGYDPQEAVKVLEALEEEEAKDPSGGAGNQSSIWSTHPSNPERILALIDQMPKALAEREKSTIGKPPPVIVK